jgi:putative ABC transport system substrate-binding protein
VLGPEIAESRDVLRGIADELSENYTIVRREVSAKATVASLSSLLREVKPNVLVLLNNSTVRLYRDYQSAQPPGTSFPPAVILMTAFMEQTAAGLQNIAGISYEIPAVTALVNLRSVLGRPLRRVGVLYREGFGAFIAHQNQLAAVEGFSIVGRLLDEGSRRTTVKRGLRKLLDYDRVDAIWVLNDSSLVNPELLARAWLPVLRHGHVPVLVGVSSLVSERLAFGTFAVVPEHRALGAQAAGLIEDVAENGWQVPARHFLLPVAVEKILHVDLARTHSSIRDEKLHEVDRVVGGGERKEP